MGQLPPGTLRVSSQREERRWREDHVMALQLLHGSGCAISIGQSKLHGQK